MSVSDEDLQSLIALMDLGRARGSMDRVSSRRSRPSAKPDDMTIFGPFGGPGARPGQLTPEALAAAQAAMSAQFFHGGDGSCEVVKTIVEGDLVVLVMIERSTVMFEGRALPHPWILRTTQIFRRTDDGWVQLHRHADPLMKLRPLEATLALLDDAA